MKKSSVSLATILFCCCCALFAAGQDIPARPEQLLFSALKFEVPDPAPLRFELANGIPVYIAEDRLLPLTNIQVLFRGGGYMEPEGKDGLASLTGSVWRTGGAGSLGPQELDEEIDFLAAELSVGVGEVTGSISLDVLSKDVDRGLELLLDVLQKPRFDEGRLAKAKDNLLAAMKRRNDSTEGIEGREWNRLIYGDDFWRNRLPTQGSVDSISREDLVRFHGRLTNPAGMVLAVAGDFSRDEMLAKLNSTLGRLERTGDPVPPVPQPAFKPKPGVYLVNKSDVNQGRVSIGHLGLKRPVPEEFDLMVANDVLGGGGFTAWMLSRVRSDEGLAYSAYSSYGIGNTIPADFQAFFQSKSASCARAAKLTLSLIDKLLEEGPSEKDLELSRDSFVQTLPNNFRRKSQTVGLFAIDELLDRPHEYWLNYREKMSQVTTESARQAARKYIRPGDLVILVVGNVEEILKGDPDHPDVKFEDLGPLVRLPLRDPMTLEPIEQ